MSETVATIIMLVELFFGVVIGIYFLSLLKSQRMNKVGVIKGSEKEIKKLKEMRKIELTEPLTEKSRPLNLSEIVGQEDGIKALKAAICSKNPQHILIYGPPGIGKTAAARLVLQEAKKTSISPFSDFSKFVEIDATTVRFDDRGIADPLIGSVHDPIYQGAGAYGPAGIPQPKLGAVTKSHGGVLFIDEIGELHPIEMNKLLKVLEDRKVFFESAYYSEDDKNIPPYIHEIFQKGLPADFRLIGATTRTPEEISPALRSRCIEIFFKPLSKEQLEQIAINAGQKGGLTLEENCAKLVALYSNSGRDIINIIQMAGSLAALEERTTITIKDIEWVVEMQKYEPIVEKKVFGDSKVGMVNGLGVSRYNYGSVLEIEVITKRANKDSKGKIDISGVAESEQIKNGNRNLSFTGTAKNSISNAITAISSIYNTDFSKYDIHVYFTGGYADGPSAGVTVATALYSAIYGLPIRDDLAMTGEISISGNIRAVGGVSSKLEAAKRVGVSTVFVPKENYQKKFEDLGLNIVYVSKINEIIEYILNRSEREEGA